MSCKNYARVSVLVLLLLAFLGTPAGAQAGGVCGGTYIVDPGDTLDSIAAKCGTTVSAITTANPGISGTLYAGQALTVPGSNYTSSGSTSTYPTYPPPSYSGTHIVQYGDTFSGIASRYGVSINNLWAANPQIRDINYIYVGQVIHVPASSWSGSAPAAAGDPLQLSYGTAPPGTPKGSVTLSNKAGTEVYVSLQGTTRDDIKVINEYSVSGTMKVSVPAGWYVYVAWVGGQKFSGGFNLGGDGSHLITFYRDKVVVD